MTRFLVRTTLAAFGSGMTLMALTMPTKLPALARLGGLALLATLVAAASTLVSARFDGGFADGVALRQEGGAHVLTLADGRSRRLKGAVLVRQWVGAVALTLHDGSSVRLPGADEAVALRIREALVTRERRRAAGLRIELLDRGTDSARRWKERLDELAKPTGDYRGGAMGPEGLDVVEDPGATPEQRVAAAYALSRVDGAPRHRIEVAARACADDDLRVALEEAAEGELAGLRVRRAMARIELS